jgi:hypothetical protein
MLSAKKRKDTKIFFVSFVLFLIFVLIDVD